MRMAAIYARVSSEQQREPAMCRVFTRLCSGNSSMLRLVLTHEPVGTSTVERYGLCSAASRLLANCPSPKTPIIILPRLIKYSLTALSMTLEICGVPRNV